jgi:hypothetical protein
MPVAFLGVEVDVAQREVEDRMMGRSATGSPRRPGAVRRDQVREHAS